MMPHLGGWCSSLFRRLAVLPLLYLLAAPRPTCGGGGQLPQDTKSSSTTAVKTPPVGAPPPIHCRFPEHCPGGVPCPSSGVCPVEPWAGCVGVKIDTIIGEGQMDIHRTRDAGECCNRCIATEHCECWTFKTAGAGRGEHDCIIKNSSHCREASHRFAQHRISGRRRLQDGDAPATCTAPLKDTDFSGHDLPGHVCAPRDNVTSAAECCSKCAAVAGCKVWTYMPGAKNCCLKTSAAGRRFERSYVSGCVEVGGSCPVPIPARPAPPTPPKPPTPSPPPPCKSDEDCSLNGVCTAGACNCDPGWTTLLHADGPWCGFLDFLPSPNSVCGPGCVFHGGAGGVDKLTTSWGGSVLPVGGSLGQWTTNSQVVTAVSDTPTGPFVRQALAIPPWSHNPEAIRTTDGTFVIYTLGPGKGLTHEVNCSHASLDNATGSADTKDTALPPNNRPPGPVNFTVHSAPSPHGPWTATTMEVHGWTNLSWTLQTPGNWNPAPVALPGGGVRVMAHTDWGPWAGEVILEAPSWKGPYKVVSGDEIDHCDYCEEDPFMWKDKRGNWHVLYHRMFDPYGPLDPNWGKEDGSWKRKGSPVPLGWAGGHAFSRTGLGNWSAWTRCYNTSIALTGGGEFEFRRRERPKLLFAADGVTPTHLYNGAISGNRGLGTYTIVAPLNVDANRKQH